MRHNVASLTAGITLAAALFAPATAHAGAASPGLGSPNGCGDIYDLGINSTIGSFWAAGSNVTAGIGDYCNIPVSPSGYFEIYQVTQTSSGPEYGCLDVNSSELYDGHPEVTVEGPAGCDSGGNGYSWDHWSAISEGSGVWAFENAYEKQCMYLDEGVAIVTSCGSAGTDRFQQFEWPGSNL